MTRWGELTPATINQIIYEIRDGEADPEDAKRLLLLFCDTASRDVPNQVIEFLQRAISGFLRGEKRTLDAAFGLARAEGRPKADEEIQTKMAASVLKLRIKGVPHQESLATVGEQYSKSQSVIREAWKAKKSMALAVVAIERSLGNLPFEGRERRQLLRIYGNANAMLEAVFATENSARKRS